MTKAARAAWPQADYCFFSSGFCSAAGAAAAGAAAGADAAAAGAAAAASAAGAAGAAAGAGAGAAVGAGAAAGASSLLPQAVIAAAANRTANRAVLFMMFSVCLMWFAKKAFRAITQEPGASIFQEMSIVFPLSGKTRMVTNLNQLAPAPHAMRSQPALNHSASSSLAPALALSTARSGRLR